MMHRTHMGVDQDYENIINQGTRAALARRLGRLHDRHRSPGHPLRNPGAAPREHQPGRAQRGRGQHHRPRPRAAALRDDRCGVPEPEMLELRREKGAKGINLAGICCTANEILMRHGVPIAGNFLQQELAIITGAVDGMVVDVQCIMQAVRRRGQVLPHQGDHDQPRAKMEEANVDAHRVPRGPGPRQRQADRQDRHRQLPQPPGRGDHPGQ